MAKWVLRSESEILAGTLQRVYVPSGFTSDGDTNLVIAPDPAHQGLLVNRHGRRNGNATMECEVNVTDSIARLWWRPLFNRWADSMMFTPISLVGVYVDDDGHDSKTELHPVDLIVGRVDQPLVPHDPSWWISRRAAERGLHVVPLDNPDSVTGELLYAYRFLASSDDRAGIAGPPLSMTTRTVSLHVAMPPAPGPTWTPYAAHSLAFIDHAEVSVGVSTTGTRHRVRITVTCQAATQGGPGIVLGEVAAYWKNPAVPEISLDPASVSFGQVIPMRTATRTIRITNIGVAPLVVSTSSPQAHSVFTWSAFSNQTIPGGGHRDVTVTFRPRTPGGATGVWHVHTNDALGRSSVQLSGTGRDVITP